MFIAMILNDCPSVQTDKFGAKLIKFMHLHKGKDKKSLGLLACKKKNVIFARDNFYR